MILPNLLCPHGMQVNTCPHCIIGNRVKPKQLINLAPRELPMKVKSVQEIEGKKSDSFGISTDNFSSKLDHNLRKGITRNFNLRESAFGNTTSFNQKRLEMSEDPEYAKMKEAILKKELLLDPKKEILK